MRSAVFTVLSGRPWLALFTALCLAAGVDTLVQQIIALMEQDAARGLEVNTALEEDMALILVGFGVWLEERGLFLGKRLDGDPPPFEEARNEDAETFGAYMLVLGLAMELLDQIDGALRTLGPTVQDLGVGLMVVMHVGGVVLLGRFLWIAAVDWRRPA